MPTGNDLTFIEKIQAKRPYADIPLSESDNSDKSPQSGSADSPEGSRREMRKQAGSAGPSSPKSYSSANSTRNQADRSVLKESYEENNFKTMIAEQGCDSEEENSCIDFSDVNFQLPQVKETPPTSGASDRVSDLPCDIFFLNDETTLQKFQTYDQLSGYLVDSSAHKKDETNTNAEVFQKLVKIPLRNAEHLISVGEYLLHLYEDAHLIDVAIDVQGKTFNAHRAALCCSSRYLAEFFDKNKSEKIPFELKIKGVTTDAFAAFLEFCYTGEITVFSETAADIIVMADFLKVDELRDRFEEIAKKLPLEHSLKMLLKTKPQKRSGKLYRVLINQVLREFKAASMLEIFLKMDFELLCRLLESDDLVAATEFEVFTVAIRWIVHDLQGRVKYTMHILSLIRFYFMTLLELYMCAETTNLVRGYDKFREMLLVATWLKTSDTLERDDPFQFQRPKPRLCFQSPAAKKDPSEPKAEQNSSTGPTLVMPPPLMTSTPKSSPKTKQTKTQEAQCVDIFVVGGFMSDDSKQSKFMEKYDIEDNRWMHFSGLPAPTRRHAVVSLNNYLYLIGGREPGNDDNSTTPRKSVFRMDIDSKKWTQVTDMNVNRHSHCACALKGLIYVIGGNGKYNSVLLSVECYDPETSGWYFVPSLPEPLSGASAATLGTRLFVTGGISVNKENQSVIHVLNTVYSFNTASNSWTRLHDLRFPRCHSALLNVDDTLYLCGGATLYHDLRSIASIDKYDAADDEWHHVTDMVVPRHDFGAAVAGSRIYMIGGITSPPGRVLQSVECFDTATFSWASGLKDLPHPARWICCCSLPAKLHA